MEGRPWKSWTDASALNWPANTQLWQAQWYDPVIGFGSPPAIHIRVHIMPPELIGQRGRIHLLSRMRGFTDDFARDLTNGAPPPWPERY